MRRCSFDNLPLKRSRSASLSSSPLTGPFLFCASQSHRQAAYHFSNLWSLIVDKFSKLKERMQPIPIISLDHIWTTQYNVNTLHSVRPLIIIREVLILNTVNIHRTVGIYF